jgi:protein SCO1/2
MRLSSATAGRERRGLRHKVAALAILVVTPIGLVALTGCGSDPEPQLAGYIREPLPQVDAVTLPDLSQGGEEFALRAPSGELLVVYFGFTNCPDICPTTLADLRTAVRRLDPADAERVSLAMISVDPDRDLPVLVDYAQTFMPDAHALATKDQSVLQRVADPFGVTYLVETDADGRIEVSHSTQTYVVDDQGRLILSWQFGLSADEMRNDLEILLAEARA